MAKTLCRICAQPAAIWWDPRCINFDLNTLGSDDVYEGELDEWDIMEFGVCRDHEETARLIMVSAATAFEHTARGLLAEEIAKQMDNFRNAPGETMTDGECLDEIWPLVDQLVAKDE